MTEKKNYSLTYPKIVAVGFALIIIIGAVLLTLPISSNRQPALQDLFRLTLSATGAYSGRLSYCA